MADSRESFFSLFYLLSLVAEFATASDISNAVCVSKRFSSVFCRDDLWAGLCARYGFKSLISSTRTRGKQSFRSIYLSALCIECKSVENSKGSVVIDTNGGSYTRMGGVDGPGSALVALCIECFRSVQSHSTHGDRMRHALQRSKHRLPYHVWSTVLGKIPFPTPTKRKQGPVKAITSGTSAVVVPAVANAGSGSGGGGAGVKRPRDRFEDPGHNDHLLKKIPK